MKLSMALLARVLALLWAGFWTFFFVAEALAWRASARAVVFWGSVGLLFLILALLPWRREVTGGLILLLAGLLMGVIYVIWQAPRLPLASSVMSTVALSGPPLVAGIVFLIHPRAVHAQS